MERADAATALHKGDHHALTGRTRLAALRVWPPLALVRRFRVLLLAEIGLIGLHNLPLASERRQIEATTAHRFHDPVMQEPSRVVLAAQFAVELVGGKA